MRGAASATADRAALPFDARRMGRYGHGVCTGVINPPQKGDAAFMKGMGRSV